jgi:predicted aspartyl protease
MTSFVAIWDTGATHSVISPNVVKACGLQSIGVQRVYHAQGEALNVKRFLVNLGLPNRVGFPGLPVTLGVLKNADVLIGMDIIGRGDFAVTNSNGKTKFSFRIPSEADIDFVKETRRRRFSHGGKSKRKKRKKK